MRIREFVTHYHQERNHQGLSNRLIVPNSNLQTAGSICRRERLGGMLNYMLSISETEECRRASCVVAVRAAMMDAIFYD